MPRPHWRVGEVSPFRSRWPIGYVVGILFDGLWKGDTMKIRFEQVKSMRRSFVAVVALALVLGACAGSAPAAVGDCVKDSSANIVFGSFPDKVDCPVEARSFQERASEPIYRVVAVGKTLAEVDANQACKDDFSFAIWYDDDWAVCGGLLP